MLREVIIGEVVAGSSAALLACPLSVVVAKSVVEYASGKGKSVWLLAKNQLISMIRHPMLYMRGFSFKWMYFVLAPTYVVSNICDHHRFFDQPSQAVQKLVAVFAVNTVTSLIRDRKYAQQFGTIPKRPFPLLSYGLFFLRDLSGMTAAFMLPSIFGPAFGSLLGVSAVNGERIAQLTLPVVQQIFSTPLHLLALDLYNRQSASFRSRLAHMSKIYWHSALMRMMRGFPTYGLGGVANTYIRTTLVKVKVKE